MFKLEAFNTVFTELKGRELIIKSTCRPETNMQATFFLNEKKRVNIVRLLYL